MQTIKRKNLKRLHLFHRANQSAQNQEFLKQGLQAMKF